MVKILLVSLGCDKNTVDSEEMLGQLREKGYSITDDETEADIAIVNTCCFIKDAADESISTILELAELKKGNLKYLIVTGCMAERYKNEVKKELPEVDAVVGVAAIDEIAAVIDKLTKSNGDDSESVSDIKDITQSGIEESKKASSDTDVDTFKSLDYLPVFESKRVLTGAVYSEYLKIAEGCNKRCTYCAIPSFRGSYRSVPKEILIRQAQYLASQGVKELILVAQETTCYGIDKYGRKTLHELIRDLSEVEGIEWIRLLYCYPEEIYDELIEEMAVNPKVCHYIDMPLQHTETAILRKMGRRLDKEDIIDIVGKLRKRIPDIVIRTTFITGFPGENEKDHENLLALLDELEFDRVGVFTYSPEEGTPAAAFPDQIDEETKERYRDEIMALQQEISYDINQRFVGQTMDVMIEGYIPDDDVYAARSFRDAPDVDGYVFVKCNYEPVSGTILKVKINSANEYDLVGEVED
ncbi:SSU ribosomal protein S12P methylthiotransferase [Eubacterium ruminantium]|nr:SSU ribosomal protein S12P methylthiotransferase [Eubacterium ruminantium]